VKWLGLVGCVGLLGACAVLPPIACGTERTIHALAVVGTRPAEAAVITKIHERRVCDESTD